MPATENCCRYVVRCRQTLLQLLLIDWKLKNTWRSTKSLTSKRLQITGWAAKCGGKSHTSTDHNLARLSATLTEIYLEFPVSLDWSWDITGCLFYRVFERGSCHDMCCKVKGGCIAEHTSDKKVQTTDNISIVPVRTVARLTLPSDATYYKTRN